MPNFAIFGGTFNPVHWGHLFIAETAFDQFRLDRVIWVPTFRSPHKAQPLVAFEHRLEMVCRAIAAHPAFTVSTVDAQQEGTSYAIDTLHALRSLEPNACWYWIIGNDAFQSLPQWKASQELAAQCIWLVAPRGGDGGMRGWGDEGMRGWGDEGMGGRGDERMRGRGDGEAGENSKLKTQNSKLLPLTPHLSLHWHPLQMPSVAISSSLIRQRCQDDRSIQYLVPEAVRCYMSEQALYQMS